MTRVRHNGCMSTPNSVFKFSRTGKVFLENVTLAEAVRLIADQTILPTDHYWTTGMTDWKLVSSRSWDNLPEAVKPPAPAPIPSPVAAPVVARPFEVARGFSPYAAYYRSKDLRWGYGIFAGLAHRNGWSASTLFQVRIFTLIFIFPAMAYVCTWGLFVMLMTPALPTHKVKSYFDVGG